MLPSQELKNYVHDYKDYFNKQYTAYIPKSEVIEVLDSIIAKVRLEQFKWNKYEERKQKLFKSKDWASTITLDTTNDEYVYFDA